MDERHSVPTERKARNLLGNTHCAITTGRNVLDGLDMVVEGDAHWVHDEIRLQRLTDAFGSKYDEPFPAERLQGGTS